MQALKLLGQSNAEIQEEPLPEVRPGWVRVRVRASCLCGSDLHGYRESGGHPVTPGHEVAGEVEAVGPEVESVQPGDRVNIHALWTCGECPACKSGRTIFCRSTQGVIGFSHDGGDADYVAVPASALYKLPEDVNWVQAALMGDGIGTPYHALKRVGVKPGETVGIFGLGPVGLGAVNIARFWGARVIAADINPLRLELARSLGANYVFNASDPGFRRDFMTVTDGEGLDRALDTSNVEATTNMALDFVRRGGTMAFVGEKENAAIHPSSQFLRKEITAVGCWYHEWGEYDEMVSLIRKGFIAERTVTHRLPISEGPEAFRLFSSGQTGKVVLTAE